MQKKAKASSENHSSKLKTLLASSDHDIVRNSKGGGYSCRRCGQSSSGRAGNESRNAWLRGRCSRQKFAFASTSVSTIPGLQLKRKEAHHSHSISKSCAPPLWYCNKCGAVAVDKMIGLAATCAGYKKKSGLNNIRAIQRGVFPGTSKRAKKWNARRSAV